MRIASIATYNQRTDVIAEAANSLAPQVDKVVIYFNPPYADITGLAPNVEVIKVQKDLKDLSKFLAIWDYPEAWIFTCDDDIIYPDNYCDLMANTGKPFVSVGGKKLVKPPYSQFITAIERNYRCLGHIGKYKDVRVDIPLTGCSYFYAKYFQSVILNLKYISMADIQMCAWCKELGIDINLIENFDGELLTYNCKMKDKETIWDTFTKIEQTKIASYLNEISELYAG